MPNLRHRNRLGIILLLAFAWLSCIPVRAGSAAPPAAWVVEWDVKSGWEECLDAKNSLVSVQIFAAYFDDEDKLFMNRRLSEWLADIAFKSGLRDRLYLTVVNDVVKTDGPNVLKDPDLVSRLLASPGSRAKHRAELVALAKDGGFAGLEIDYERVKTKDWSNFLLFCADLHKDLAAEGIRLRVVLEPRKNYLSKPLPPGPEYTIMAYNLFGGHTGPGPKADPSFISRIASYCRAAKITPRPRLALATGGFSWNSDGTVTSVTESQARELAIEGGVVLKRHPYSQYLAFTVENDDGLKREIWFADEKTFAHLLKSAKNAGFERFDIWRLGGNAPEALAAFENAGKR